MFAIRLRPAGLAVLSNLAPSQLADAILPLTSKLDPRLHALIQRIASGVDPTERAQMADEAIRQAAARRAPSSTGLLANDVLDELRERIHHRTSATLTEQFARSARTIQRACLDTLGHGPKWLSRRVRLQEVALALATRPAGELAVIAADLGYTDQSHLTRDFRTATGMTPDAYRRASILVTT